MSEPRPYFIFVESNTSGTGAIFASKAYEAGFTPVLVAADPPKYDFAGDPWLRLETCDTYNAAALLALARKLASSAPIAGVFSSSEYFIARAAELSRSLGLPGPDPARIEACRDKSVQRRTVTMLGIDDLGYMLAQTPAQAARYAADSTGPVVIKPIRGSGSAGVKLCRNHSEALAHATQLIESTPGAPFLVEDYAPGREFSVEMFDGEVCGLVDKHLGPEPHFVEFGHDFPARVSADLAQRLGGFAKECVHALGITWGPAHVEVRSDGTKVHLVEVNPRLAGGFIPTMIEAASGQDLIAATIAKAAGRRISAARRSGGYAALRFIVPSRSGVLVDVSGLDKAKSVRGIVSARVDRKLPLVFETRHDFRDRVGHLIATGRDPMASINAVEHAMRLISLGFADGKWEGCHNKEEAES